MFVPREDEEEAYDKDTILEDGVPDLQRLKELWKDSILGIDVLRAWISGIDPDYMRLPLVLSVI